MRLRSSIVNRALLLLCVILLLQGCGPSLDHLQQINERGTIRVATVISATTYYDGADGPMGMEYDLIHGLATSLNLKLDITLSENRPMALQLLDEGKVDMVAASLPITEKLRQNYQFSVPYSKISQQLIYMGGRELTPKSIEELNGEITVLKQSVQSHRLRELQFNHRDLIWSEVDNGNMGQLLDKVANGSLDYTVVDSNTFRLNRHLYPKLQSAKFPIMDEIAVGWVFRKESDPSFIDKANDYINSIHQSEELSFINDRYYGLTEQFNYVDLRTFHRKVDKLLPKYQALFEYTGEEFNLDWRLLAAMAYQESHWRPKAKSPTGVRGLMMLTRATSKLLGVKDRLDPVESIRGGGMYLKSLYEKLPPRFDGPDRIWLAVASYNIGYWHVRDAQKITKQRGGDPSIWRDLRENLPLLQKKKWYKKAKYGFARGNEAVIYVDNIRRYYDILLRNELNQPQEESIKPQENKALSILPLTL